MMKHKLKFYWYKLFGKLYYHDIDGWHTGAGGIVIEYKFYYVLSKSKLFTLFGYNI